MTRAFIGVGSNIEPAANVRKALKAMSEEMRVIALSTVYQTEPEARPDQPPYYNCVVELETDAPPPELKRALGAIEERLGRRRSEDRYAPRPIDLDLLVYDDLAMQSDELTLPDPEIERRAYLAVALAELAPELSLPGRNETMAELARRLPRHGMRPLEEYTSALRKEVADGS
ncbi:MAG: 2-amino-4-hydroxy-6-hydroxymethyldihydropteridine diphosphokinase [Dehalococcoidia bacterium]